MIKLKKLQIKNVTPFKSASIDLDYVGVTVIRGLNKDAGPKVSNAAGKSALIGSLPELVLDESPNGKALKIKGQKAEKSAIRVLVEKNKHDWTVTKKFGKGKDYEILKDGNPTNSRTVNYNQKKIAELFGMSDTQFYSRFYLDSTIPHPLFSLKAAVRQDYIVELFNLNDVDHIRKLLNAELTALGKKAVELRTLNTSIDELKSDRLPKEERVNGKARLAELMDRQSKLTNHLQASQAAAELMAFERQNKAFIAELRTLTTLDELQTTFKATKIKIQRLKDQREAAADWNTYDRLVRLYERANEPARVAMEDAGVESASSVKDGVRQLQELETEIRQIANRAVDPGDRPAKVAEPSRSRDVCVAQVSKLKHELDNIRLLGSGTCPTCGQTVSTRKPAQVQAELEKWRRRHELTLLWESYTKQKTEWAHHSREYEAALEKLAKLRKKAKKLKPLLKIAELLDDVPVKPRKPDSARPEGFDEAKLEKLQAKLQVLQRGRDLQETLQACEQLSKDQREKATQSSKFLTDLNSIQAEVSNLTAKLAGQDEIGRRLKTLKLRAVDLEVECRDEKLLKALVGAYSKQGLKAFMIQRYSKLLEAQVNKYRKIFFEEDYSFEFAYDSNLSVLVHRKYGKRVKSSDVRKLSGAEKRMFTLLLVVSTITMLPAHQRLNVLILDELEANMGPDFVDKLIRTLPLVQKLVPHIVFVTPRTEIEIPNSRVFTVVKQHGVATLSKAADPVETT